MRRYQDELGVADDVGWRLLGRKRRSEHDLPAHKPVVVVVRGTVGEALVLLGGKRQLEDVHLHLDLGEQTKTVFRQVLARIEDQHLKYVWT